MSKIKKYILISSGISFILYIGMSLWLYFQDKADTTGWASLGVVAFSIIFVFPAIALAGGISGQLITGKVWIFPLINSIGSVLFIATTFALMNDTKIQILILVPVVFTVTFIVSLIVMGIKKLFN